MKIEADVLRVLENATIDGHFLTITEQLDRKLYVKVNKVLEALGGSWKRKEKAHAFMEDPRAAIQRAINEEEVTIPKEFGFFPTPLEIVHRLLEMAQIKHGMQALEPSAGTGNIAREIARITEVDCIEFLPDNVKKLQAEGFARNVWQGDFLQIGAAPVYDRIVMNPPFERQADILHVKHAFAHLRRGGRLVSVMGAGVTFRDNSLTKNFRELVENQGGIITPLPDEAFKASGTKVRTVMVFIPN